MIFTRTHSNHNLRWFSPRTHTNHNVGWFSPRDYVATNSVRRGEATVPWPPPQTLKIKNVKTVLSKTVVPNRGAVAPWGAICNTQGCRELIRFLLYHWKDIFKMSPKLNPNCYGFATRCRKLYFRFVGCRKPKKVGNHWSKTCFQNAQKCVFLGIILQNFPGSIPPVPLEWSYLRHFPQRWFVTSHDCDEICPPRKCFAYATGGHHSCLGRNHPRLVFQGCV